MAIDNAPPPPELVKAWSLKRWGGLWSWPPVLGEQDAGEMLRMTACLNVHEAFTGLYAAENVVTWAKANAGAMQIVSEVRKMAKQTEAADTEPIG